MRAHASIHHILFLASAVAATAAEPRAHVAATPEELLGGETENVQVLSRGRAILGPSIESLASVPAPVVWSIAADGDDIWVGTGHEGKVYLVQKGAAKVVFDAPEIEVTALLPDKKGAVLAATSPQGKVYRIERNGDAASVFTPPDRFIWCLAWDGDDLLVATGSPARVYRVAMSGEHTVLWKSTERNVTTLAKVGTALFAGTDGAGKLYRVMLDGSAFAVWDSTLPEIASLVAMENGDLLAVAVEAAAAPSPPRPTTPAAKPPGAPDADKDEKGKSEGVPPPPASAPTGGHGEIARINGQGSVELLSGICGDPLRATAAPTGDATIVVSDPRGARLARVGADGNVAVIGTIADGQASAILALPDGRCIVGTSNPGAVWIAGRNPETRGSLTGGIVDAGAVSRFGVLTLVGQAAGGRLDARVRTGNSAEPGSDWTGWSQAIGSGDKVPGPPARYLQWKVELAGQGEASPWLERVEVTSLQQNLAPRVDTVTLLPPGVVFKTDAADPAPRRPPAEIDLFAARVLPGSKDTADGDAPPVKKKELKKGLRTVVWTAHDPNQDRLAFDVAYRKDDAGSAWVPLTSGASGDAYAFDTSGIPDGLYRLRVTASDRPDNALSTAQSGSFESQAFVVDNTSPRVDAQTSAEGATIHASDASGLFLAYVSFQNGPFVPVLPEDGITDDVREVYHVRAADLAAMAAGDTPRDAPAHPAGGLLQFKAFDRSGNVGSVSVTLGKP
ncbi:MAG: hypothetical protein U0166_25780 [Acidobacteriota bacterium]